MPRPCDTCRTVVYTDQSSSPAILNLVHHRFGATRLAGRSRCTYLSRYCEGRRSCIHFLRCFCIACSSLPQTFNAASVERVDAPFVVPIRNVWGGPSCGSTSGRTEHLCSKRSLVLD